jgi:hypothetical protein
MQSVLCPITQWHVGLFSFMQGDPKLRQQPLSDLLFGLFFNLNATESSVTITILFRSVSGAETKMVNFGKKLMADQLEEWRE